MVNLIKNVFRQSGAEINLTIPFVPFDSKAYIGVSLYFSFLVFK